MINLESANLSVETTLKELRDAETPVLIDRIVLDFDNTLFHIVTPDSNQKTQIFVLLFIKCFEDLITYGDVLNRLNSTYSNGNGIYSVSPQPEDGYHFTLILNLEQLKAAPNSDEIISSIALLKRNAFAAPFSTAFERYDVLAREAAEKGLDLYAPEAELETILVIRYRDDESIYIRPSHDRVTVIFTALFKDETDKIYGSVFLQEFVDARKRSVQNAPQVLFSPYEPPMELRQLPEFSNFTYGQKPTHSKNEKGFVTFVLFPRHLTVQKRENTISQIQLFRTYFHYHIKASKAYLHSRMRKRVLEYLKILNRAKPDQEEKDIERKTASGRRFVQRT